MAVLEFNTAPAANTSANTRRRNNPFSGMSTTQEQQPDAQVWLNIGYQAGDAFINLPFGLPIDTMREVDVRGQNEDYVKQQHARNNLLHLLKEGQQKLQPGEVVNVNLIIQMRRVKDQLAVKPDENEYAIGFDGLLLAAE